MTDYLKRDDILAVQDLRRTEVKVPEWGGIVLVREPTADEMQSLGFGMATPDGTIDVTRDRHVITRLVTWCIIDADGKPVFSEKDVTALGRKAWAPIERIFNTITDMGEIEGAGDAPEGNA